MAEQCNSFVSLVFVAARVHDVRSPSCIKRPHFNKRPIVKLLSFCAKWFGFPVLYRGYFWLNFIDDLTPLGKFKRNNSLVVLNLYAPIPRQRTQTDSATQTR
jgi:hypothetical protein